MNAKTIRKISLLLPIAFICGCISHVASTSTLYVGGEFHKPGLYPWTNGITAADIVRQAGGFTVFASPSLVIRHSDGTYERYRLELGDRQITNGTDWVVPNIALKPEDRILNPHDEPW
ncbi:MAG TPA: hypothetical protein VMH87_01235 [Pseudomonadales bacterium]|nr:hypothetical protein [Pseudomonadales bacterium]